MAYIIFPINLFSFFFLLNQANIEHSKHRVFPVPVGDSSAANPL